jgi:hypothetical protein
VLVFLAGDDPALHLVVVLHEHLLDHRVALSSGHILAFSMRILLADLLIHQPELLVVDSL